ncbi:MAG: hypothetical protein ACOZQL_40710 [Myxococcota bacterium]
MDCSGLEAEVERIRELVEARETNEKPIGKALLLGALRNAEERLAQCRGKVYRVNVSLFDFTSTFAPQSLTARLVHPSATGRPSSTRFEFTTVPSSLTGLVVEGGSPATVLCRSPRPLPGIATASSDVTIVVWSPVSFSDTELSSRLPTSDKIPTIPTIVISTVLGPLTLDVRLSSLSFTLGNNSVSVTIAGRIITGPSLAQAATTLFSHSANYTLAPCTDTDDWARAIVAAAPIPGSLTLTPTAGWAFFRPLGSTILWAANAMIEEELRRQVANQLGIVLNREIRAAVAAQRARLPLPTSAPLLVSLRSVIVRPTKLILNPVISVHV